MKVELESIERNGTWELEPRPALHKFIGVKWVLKFKCHSDESVHKQKARWMSNFKSAFLNVDLKEEIYVEQPPGLENPQSKGMIYMLKKTLYVLK